VTRPVSPATHRKLRNAMERLDAAAAVIAALATENAALRQAAIHCPYLPLFSDHIQRRRKGTPSIWICRDQCNGSSGRLQASSPLGLPSHYGVVADFWGSIIGALIGAGAAVLVGLLAARWGARYTALHQRAAQMQDALVLLYADIYADIAMAERELFCLTEPGGKMHGVGPDRATIGGRLMLLSPPSVTTAWEAYIVEFDYLRDYVNSATNFRLGGLLDISDQHIVRCREAIEDLKVAVQHHLGAR